MIDHFVDLITDETDLETVAQIAYASDPDPTAFVTRGETASQVAQAMQYGVYAQLDAEAMVEEMQEKINDQDERIANMQKRLSAADKRLDDALSMVTKLTRMLHAKGVIQDDNY